MYNLKMRAMKKKDSWTKTVFCGYLGPSGEECEKAGKGSWVCSGGGRCDAGWLTRGAAHGNCVPVHLDFI